MKKILILQMRPENETSDSEFEAIVKVGNIEREQVHRIRVEQLEKFDIELNNYCAIIAGGSPFDVSCPVNKKSAVQKQIESFFNSLFDQVIAIDFPFLGACSGNGLLGSYCGTTISGKYSEPIGSVTVTVTEAGEKDDLLIGLPKQFPVFVGHKEACDNVPQSSVLLVSSETCPVQMFRIKKNIYATQFHPEADVEEFILRINTYKHYGYFPPEKSDELISTIKDIETPVAKEILRRFIIKYKHN
jgi:GMP synthase (glutamine-hydrolysing)